MTEVKHDALISRAAAIAPFKGKPPEYYSTSYIIDTINSLSAVDAMPVVHGRWVEIDEGDDDYTYDCSLCGFKWWLVNGTPLENGMKYCPHCGAKMDEGTEDCE